MGWPSEPFTVQSLGLAAATGPGRIGKLELLGTGQTIKWAQQANALRVELPHLEGRMIDYAAVLKVTFV